jgi:hypothetical protein
MKLNFKIRSTIFVVLELSLWFVGWRIWDAFKLWQYMTNITYQTVLAGAIAVFAVLFAVLFAVPLLVKVPKVTTIYKSSPKISVSYASMIPDVKVPVVSAPTIQAPWFSFKRKPKEFKVPLNEVTVTIMAQQEKTNYHETFMLDLTKENSFEYNGFTYQIPIEETGHYPISFWNIQAKFATFYERHKTLASLFDWFHFRDRATVEVGYLYMTENSKPFTFDDLPENHDLKQDWAIQNYMLEKNTTIEEAHREADKRLQGDFGDSINPLWIILGIVAIVAVCVVLVAYLATGGGSGGNAQVIQNITDTNATVLRTAIPLK